MALVETNNGSGSLMNDYAEYKKNMDFKSDHRPTRRMSKCHWEKGIVGCRQHG